jgi:hypothetical protein
MSHYVPLRVASPEERTYEIDELVGLQLTHQWDDFVQPLRQFQAPFNKNTQPKSMCMDVDTFVGRLLRPPSADADYAAEATFYNLDYKFINRCYHQYEIKGVKQKLCLTTLIKLLVISCWAQKYRRLGNEPLPRDRFDSCRVRTRSGCKDGLRFN